MQNKQSKTKAVILTIASNIVFFLIGFLLVYISVSSYRYITKVSQDTHKELIKQGQPLEPIYDSERDSINPVLTQRQRKKHLQKLKDTLSPQECIHLNMFYETRSDKSIISDFAVSWVVINRVKSSRFPNAVCDVVLQDRQFSWTNNRRISDLKDPVLNKIEQEAWDKAAVHAEIFMNYYKNGYDFTKGSDHYHAKYVKPSWNKGMASAGNYGSHRFWSSN